jgi:hypothetical protein
MVAVVNREQAVGVSLLNCQKHRSSPAFAVSDYGGLRSEMLPEREFSEGFHEA